jgi:ubiquinone/menaquinone biosynthesis C-methylase UbiE
MNKSEIRKQWEMAAPGWAKWESKVADWMKPATEVMLDMAGIDLGASVLDLACGAGSQTLLASKRVGDKGHIIASDISEKMLQYVRDKAGAAHIKNVSTMLGTAEELELPADSLDAAICRIALMLFNEPGKALKAVYKAIRVKGKMSVIVFSTPDANPFMAKPMQILLRHAGKEPPAPGQPGIFALGKSGVLEQLFEVSGFNKFEKKMVPVSLSMPSAAQALFFMQEAAGAYRAVLSECSEEVKKAAWAEVGDFLRSFEKENGVEAPGEVIVAAGVKSA